MEDIVDNLQIITIYMILPVLLIRINRNECVKTATEVGVRAIQDHKVIEWNTCWKCRLSGH
jgi:hypothetical protein